MTNSEMIACAIFATAMILFALIPSVKIVVYGEKRLRFLFLWLGADVLAAIYGGLALFFYHVYPETTTKLILTMLGVFIFSAGFSLGFAWVFDMFRKVFFNKDDTYNNHVGYYDHIERYSGEFQKVNGMCRIDGPYERIGAKNVVKTGMQRKFGPCQRLDSSVRLVDSVRTDNLVRFDTAYVSKNELVMPSLHDIHKCAKKTKKRRK